MSLSFGTAGMRAPVGPADNQMNVRQVTRISAGVAAWLAEQAAQSPHAVESVYPGDSAPSIGLAFHEDDAALRIVVGYDARYGSHAFATATAEVFAGAGFEVFLMPTPTPTPIVPWLIKQWHLDGGVQITASHNPAPDNGYKVYTSLGRQISSAAASEIEECIDAVGPAVDVPRVFVRPASDQLRRYVDDVVGLVAPKQADLLRVNNERASLRIAFTAMHGVGGRALMQGLQAAGFVHIFPVAEQHYPDPTFPTVEFPNPEEPAAVERLLAHGDKVDADVLIALDPDADRCAVGVRCKDGTLRMLRGDETGPLLATRLIPRWEGSDTGKRPIVATTIVSSQLLPTIAADRGWDLRQTLTGFKNLMAAAGTEQIAYGCEEAVGIAPAPALVDDKDGIATALLICAWAAELKARRLTLLDELDELYRAYGVHVGHQISARTVNPTALITSLSRVPWEELLGFPGEVRSLAEVSGLPAMNGMQFLGQHEAGRVRIIARASGTESKAKIYIEITQDPGDLSRRHEAAELLESVSRTVSGLVARL
ncbi:phospho-sugar mutase [Corynebacterium vitaeruminis]|uniref:phospho-sugar mutase n=1 Tax=Corynebacterium vitaeruminis TaxID=38305 RepID=UPI0023F41724|nr:phospho-sugar mutase [Corynebacterium vitaeruminis]